MLLVTARRETDTTESCGIHSDLSDREMQDKVNVDMLDAEAVMYTDSQGDTRQELLQAVYGNTTALPSVYGKTSQDIYRRLIETACFPEDPVAVAPARAGSLR